VVKDGLYGKPPRQRFRCTGPDGFHRFTPKLPRVATAAGVCDTCDGPVHAHAGPVVSRTYSFPVREVAAAFVAVGTGSSYMQAADRARVAARRPRLDGERGGALVAEWLDLLADVVIAPHAETAWPETLVLDSTRFMVENVRTGTPSLAFNVLGAYGYPASGRARVWELRASHQARTRDWVDFLETLDCTQPPRLVITDGATEIRNAVRQVWPEQPSPSCPMPWVARCEHHLRENISEALADDRVDHFGSVRMDALNEALHSTAGWEAFTATVTVKQAATFAWLATNGEAVRKQVAVRHLLPDHHSTAALDQRLGRVRDFLDSRSFVLRNKQRTNRLLGLVRNHLNGVDVERHYFTQLRAHLEAGPMSGQREGYDTGAGPRTTAGSRQPASLRR